MTSEERIYWLQLAVALVVIFGPVIAACFLSAENPWLNL
jgi:hypothetical protein